MKNIRKVVSCGFTTITFEVSQTNADLIVSESSNMARIFAFEPCYYGRDFIYSSCNVRYGGVNYNYNYAFSNGTYCFFRVCAE